MYHQSVNIHHDIGSEHMHNSTTVEPTPDTSWSVYATVQLQLGVRRQDPFIRYSKHRKVPILCVSKEAEDRYCHDVLSSSSAMLMVTVAKDG